MFLCLLWLIFLNEVWTGPMCSGVIIIQLWPLQTHFTGNVLNYADTVSAPLQKQSCSNKPIVKQSQIYLLSCFLQWRWCNTINSEFCISSIFVFLNLFHLFSFISITRNVTNNSRCHVCFFFCFSPPVSQWHYFKDPSCYLTHQPGMWLVIWCHIWLVTFPFIYLQGLRVSRV